VDTATKEVYAYVVRSELVYANENIGSRSTQASQLPREIAMMEVVDDDRIDLRRGKVSVTVQEHMHEKESTRTVLDMTMHNQRHAEESIYHGVHRRRRCKSSTGGQREGCGQMTLERPVVSPVAGWPRGEEARRSRHRRRSGRHFAHPIESSGCVPTLVVKPWRAVVDNIVSTGSR
jgi:hypothetical protein